ncbi:lathosterol oxidase [Exaiptasia diaphana]|uniref:Fatty acid hydroxylase domain-containing protein n=1 Tax=Exaiptasia diaphana TaxID=2652724 RepID=A0A913X6K6_EXADI|nr:lathosterol oxidase [Exaiptasia diaphana]
MDLVLNFVDYHFFTPYVYPSSWSEDDMFRQILTLLLLANIGGVILYLATASFSFFFVFDRRLLQHPQILENQIYLEIMVALKSIPFMSLPTVALFMVEVRGYSRLHYISVSEIGLWRYIFDLLFSTVCVLLFTDCLIYWIHRGLHHRLVYKYLHKVHHKWKVPTPFASHAFHPVDGFLQSFPYHIYPFIFPLNKIVYLVLFLFVNFWTVSIHDGDYRVPDIFKPFVNGSAHHTDHHTFFDYNYGQFFTLWDRIGGSFRSPTAFEGKAPIDYVVRNAPSKNKAS